MSSPSIKPRGPGGASGIAPRRDSAPAPAPVAPRTGTFQANVTGLSALGRNSGGASAPRLGKLPVFASRANLSGGGPVADAKSASAQPGVKPAPSSPVVLPSWTMKV